MGRFSSGFRQAPFHRVSIDSTTIQEIIDHRDGAYLKHDKRTEALSVPIIVSVEANTVHFKCPSGTTPGKLWDEWVSFEDFYLIAKDKDIPLSDAVEYAIDHGDVLVWCSCPANLYWGYNYIQTQLDFALPPHFENRKPMRNNVSLKGTTCKHLDKVLRYLQSHKSLIAMYFKKYYAKLDDDRFAVRDGDVFVAPLEPEQPEVIEAPEKPDVPDVIEAEEVEEAPEVIEAGEEEELPDVIEADEA